MALLHESGPESRKGYGFGSFVVTKLNCSPNHILSMSKDTYRVRNWHHYNEGLKQRGSLTLWISKEAWEVWRYHGEPKKGGQFRYSDLAIETCLTVRMLYHLPLRATEGFMKSLIVLMHLSLPIPDYSTLQRRSTCLSVAVKPLHKKAITDLVVDATGLKVFGEGEWKIRQHGKSKHRAWMKLHVALDAASQQAWAVSLTTNEVDDAAEVPTLLKSVDVPIRSFIGDGAYDKVKVRRPLYERALSQGEDILQLMNLQQKAIVDVKQRIYTAQRDQDIKVIGQVGLKKWKVLSGYHQRSKAETFMFRYKTTLGDHIHCRTLQAQSSEVKLGAKILNLMLKTAKPISERVA